MKMHRIAIGVALVVLPGLALAQTQTQTPSTGSCADKQQIGCTDTFSGDSTNTTPGGRTTDPGNQGGSNGQGTTRAPGQSGTTGPGNGGTGAGTGTGNGTGTGTGGGGNGSGGGGGPGAGGSGSSGSGG